MPKELPYFQFEPAEWANGDIQLCSFEAKGYFIDIQCWYWQRECMATRSELERRFQRTDLLKDLIEGGGVIKIQNEKVIIEFLIDQYELISYKKKVNSVNGSKGAQVKKQMRLLQQKEPQRLLPFPQPEGNTTGNFFYIGTELYNYPVSKYIREEMAVHAEQFMMQMKPITLDQVLKEMDSICVGAPFSNHKHVINLFNKVARELKAGKPNNKSTNQQSVKASGNYGGK